MATVNGERAEAVRCWFCRRFRRKGALRPRPGADPASALLGLCQGQNSERREIQIHLHGARRLLGEMKLAHERS